MSTGPDVPPLAARAAAATEATATLFSELRAALAGSLGIDLLDLQSRAADGAWVMVCRFRAAESATAEEPAAPALGVHDEGWTVPAAPEPPFQSPILSSPPFDGDGSNDLLRFIREADDDVRVPPPGPPGELPPPLAAETRARMLASTIAGDVVLALMHEGGADDPARLEAALGEGWERYTTELRRLGRKPDPALYRRAGELAATMIVEGI